jgi:hypothetical protein
LASDLRDPWDDEQAKARTYTEMLSDRRLTRSEEMSIKADAALGLTAVLLQQRGQQETAMLLLDVIQPVLEQGDETWEYQLWLEVAPEHLEEFTKDAITAIDRTCCEVSARRGYGIFDVSVREILPEVGPEWRENLRQQSNGKRPTNHARRMRPEPSRPREDGLTFTNDGELTVYRALKRLQESSPRDETIGIFPLAGGRLPGKTWEPDVLVTYKGRAGILEIDGPHHNARRAMDTTRDHMWLDAGVAFVDRIPVEALSDPKELEASLRRFLKRLVTTR